MHFLLREEVMREKVDGWRLQKGDAGMNKTSKEIHRGGSNTGVGTKRAMRGLGCTRFWGGGFTTGDTEEHGGNLG
jgi:hypothetical protein